jgi:hypothetical protein
MALCVTPASAQQMISNGSFEVGSPAPGGSGQLQIAAGDTANLPGWSASTGMGWYFRATAWGLTAPDGEMLFNLYGTTGAYTLSQSFAVTAGNTYTVSYYEAARNNDAAYIETTVSVADGTVAGAGGLPTDVEAGPASSIVQTSLWGNRTFVQYTFTFTPSADTTATLTFGNHYTGVEDGRNGAPDGVFLDKVSVLGPAVLTATTTALQRNSGTVTPSVYGDALSFDVTIDPATATGTVDLYDGGASGTLIGTGELLDGACTITTTALAVGTHDNIVAVYIGDFTHAPSTSDALSPAQEVNSGAAAAQLFTTPPSDAQPGEVWATQPTVVLLDASGNIANSDASVTLAITSGTPTSGGPGTLIGTTTVAAVNGVATFSDLAIDTAGVGYRLTATSADLTPADSALFTISSGTVLYDSTACSGQFPRTTLDFTPVEGHVYTLSFSLNNPDASLNNCLIGFSPYAQADNTYNADKLIDGFWVSGTWLGNGSVRRNYNGGIVEESFTSAGSGNGYWGPPGELVSNFEFVLDTTSSPWKTSTSMSSGLGTLSGSVLDAVGTAKSVQVWVRDAGNGLFPTISNFRLTDTAFVGSTPSTTTLARSLGTDETSTYGVPLSFDVTVTGDGVSGTPTGIVTLKAGTTTLGSGTLDGAGACTITTTTPLAVTHDPILAVYSGNSSTYAASTSDVLTPDQTVTPASSTVAVTGATSYIHTGNPQGPSTADTSGSTGAVTYSYEGTSSTTYGPTDIQPTDIGTYSCTATLAADANHAGAVSDAFAFAIIADNVATVVQSHDFAASNLGSLYNGSGSTELVNSSFFSTDMQPFDPSLGTLQSFTVKWEVGGSLAGTVGPGGGGASASLGGTFYIVGSPYDGGGGGNSGLADAGQPLVVVFAAPPFLKETTFPAVGGTYDPAILAAVTGTTPFAVAFTSPVTVSYTNVVDLLASVTGKVTLTYTYAPASSKTYADWAADNGLTEPANPSYVGPDGLTNLLIYALDLKTDGTNGSPGTLTGKVLSFTKRLDAVTNGDVTYAIEVSADLGQTDPWTGVDAVESTTAPYTISYTLPDGVIGGKIFARLVVTQK